jgi:23S rRNA (cytosine1962-C5)-methyltransferase
MVADPGPAAARPASMAAMAESTLVLRPGRDRSLRRRHPWIFAGGLDLVRGDPAPGDTVVIRAASGEFLARAAYSPASSIVARVWSFDEDERVDE